MKTSQSAPKRPDSSFLRKQESRFTPPPPRLDTRFRGYDGHEPLVFAVKPSAYFQRRREEHEDLKTFIAKNANFRGLRALLGE
jgi:hypothetical protein